MAIAHERPPPAGWERNRIALITLCCEVFEWIESLNWFAM
nr:MAG TPA: hypothetical protein [Caudoviricetes sp.]